MRTARSIALAIFLSVGLAACNRNPSGQEPEQTESQVPDAPVKGVDRSHSGTLAPDVLLLNADDEKQSLESLSGKPVLVNLWASWCAPCVRELPTLEALSSREGGPRVIAVSEDVGERPSVDAFLAGHKIDGLEVWRDPEMKLTGALSIQVMPTTVYYDSSGREVWRYVGDLDWTGEEAARLLSESKAAGAS